MVSKVLSNELIMGQRFWKVVFFTEYYIISARVVIRAIIIIKTFSLRYPWDALRVPIEVFPYNLEQFKVYN